MKNLTWNPFEFTNAYVKSMEEANASDKPVKYIMAEDGKVYEMRSTSLGDFIAEAKEVKGAGKVEVGFKLNVPKIPFKLLLQTVSFFRDVCDEFANDEAMLQYWYDSETGEFFAKCLEQTTNKTHVTFVRDEELETNPRYILVMDIHSHNNMEAFFSGTDDASEQQTRTYGVIGRLDKQIPHLRFRYSVEGSFVEVNIEEFFEMPTIEYKYTCDGVDQTIPASAELFYPQVEYPKEWLAVIEAGKRNASRFNGIGNAHRYGKQQRQRHSSYEGLGAYSEGKNLPIPRDWNDDGAIDLTGLGADPFAVVDQLSLFNNQAANSHTWGVNPPNAHTSFNKVTEVTSDDGSALADEIELEEVAGFYSSQLDVIEDPSLRVESVAKIVDGLSMFEIKMLVDRMLELGHESEIVDQLKDNGYKVNTR